MHTKIFNLSDLVDGGKKLAKLAANRQIRRAILAAKKKSLRQFGQAVPAIIVDAKAAVEQGFAILDFRTGAQIPTEEVDNYVVVVDGAHRLEAHLKLLEEMKEGEYTDDFYFMFPLSEKQNQDIGQLLAEINTCTTPWKGGDYAIGASIMVDEDLPVLSFITELAKKGCSLHAASIWASLTDTITKRVIVKAMNGEIEDSLKLTKNLEYGKKLYIQAVKTFGEEFLKTRTLADWVLKTLNITQVATLRSTIIEKIEAFFHSLTEEEVEEIVNLRGCRGGETKEALVNKRLDELFQTEAQR